MFPYIGGKSRLKQEITKALFRQSGFGRIPYREAFVGGGSVVRHLTEKALIPSIWINDRDPHTACWWHSVIHHPEELVKAIRAITPTIETFYSTREKLLAVQEMPTDPAEIIATGVNKCVIQQLSFGGLGLHSAGSRKTILNKWTPEHHAIEIMNTSYRFRRHRVRCTNLDFEDVIGDTSSRSVLYLDPPYYKAGPGVYTHSFTMHDHRRLANALRATRHRWVLSYDDCPEIVALYKSWAHIEVVTTVYCAAFMRSKRHDKKEPKRELIITPHEGQSEAKTNTIFSAENYTVEFVPPYGVPRLVEEAA